MPDVDELYGLDRAFVLSRCDLYDTAFAHIFFGVGYVWHGCCTASQ